MSYTKSLQCGCTAYVACWPQTGIAHTTILELRGAHCTVRGHERGLKLWTAPREAAASGARPWSASSQQPHDGQRERQIA